MNTWLFFAALAPLLWGFSNVVDTAVRRRHVLDNFTNMWFLAAARLPLIIILIIFTWPQNLPSTGNIIGMMVAGILWMLPFVLYYRAVEFEEPSRIALLLQMSNLFILPIAFFVIGERLAGT
ncbi:MAG: EamA family transporter, partial [Patescibacteria group bacterium]